MIPSPQATANGLESGIFARSHGYIWKKFYRIVPIKFIIEFPISIFFFFLVELSPKYFS